MRSARWFIVAGVVAAIAVAVTIWRRDASRPTDVPVTSAPANGSATTEQSMRKAEAAARARIPAIERPTRVSPSERDEIEKRFAEARERRDQARAQGPAAGGSAGEPLAPMENADDVLVELQVISKELKDTNAACIEKFAPGVKSFEAQLVLSGDPDVGTLIDASTPVVDENGAALPSKFDDCVRNGLQSLALPPTKLGEEYKVTMTFEAELAPRL